MPIIHLLHQHPLSDVSDACTALASQARSGDLVGMSAALMYRGGRFDVLVRGVAVIQPLEALGVVHVLQAELADIANGKRPR